MSEHRVSGIGETFDEQRLPKKVAPGVELATAFDWRSVELALGEEPESEEERETLRIAGIAFGRLIRWLNGPIISLLAPGSKCSPAKQVGAIARTVIAIAWTLEPETFGGISLAELSRRTRIPRSLLIRSRRLVVERFGDPRRP